VGVRPTNASVAPIRARLAAGVSSRGARPTVTDLPTLSAFLSILVGGIVLVGWWLGIDGLKSLVPGSLTMKLNTALAFVLLGVGLLDRSRPIGTRWHRMAVVPLIAMMLLSAAVGSQYLTGQDSGIDQWLFRELAGQIGTVHPNRMAPMTVICFLLIGTGILLASRGRTRRVVPALLLVALILASLNVLDFIFQAKVPSVLAGSTQMALITAVTMVVVSIGALGLLPHGGPLEVFVGTSSSARLARRLVVASLVAPVVLTWLDLEGEARGFYGTRYGASLIVLGTFVFLAAVIWQSARSARRTEIARLAALEERDRFFDVSMDLMATANADGYFIRLNPAWKATLGYDIAELLSRPFVEFVHPDDVAATNIEAARQINEGKTVLNFLNRYRHSNGSYRWLEWTSTPSADGSRLYATARDVTIRKQEEERLEAPIRADRERRAEARRMIEVTIEARAFRPVFQPVIDLSSGVVVGFEALTRFTDGCRPDVMFATALECGLGIELEAVTLEAALDEARLLPPKAWLSLNLSPALLCDVETLRPVLGQHSRSIVLEVTEHEAIGAYEPLHQALTQLGPGVQLAVDDAGAGIANFSHLVELRPDFVKIDASLIRGVDTDVRRQAVVVGLVHFAAAAGCLVIAEGIETEGELKTVAELGIGLGQGFLLARPAAAEAWKATRNVAEGRASALGSRRRLRVTTAPR
jgi:PAS domain S-box-containing protein